MRAVREKIPFVASVFLEEYHPRRISMEDLPRATRCCNISLVAAADKSVSAAESI